MSELSVYLSGEIHTDWRERIISGAKAAGLDIAFAAPVTDHEASDDCGVAILGAEADNFWKDHKGAKLNAIRTRTLIEKAMSSVVRFRRQVQAVERGFRRRLCGSLSARR